MNFIPVDSSFFGTLLSTESFFNIPCSDFQNDSIANYCQNIAALVSSSILTKYLYLAVRMCVT